jgi:hypothetical protein
MSCMLNCQVENFMGSAGRVAAKDIRGVHGWEPPPWKTH